MEKNSSHVNKRLKDEMIGGSRSSDGKGATVIDYSWGNSTSHDPDYSVGDGGDLLGGFSWPPRSYTCTFCKREFRSAQALGGHMNVHRRDRAKLRQMPCPSSRDLPHPQNHSLLHTSPSPSPNPNLKFSKYNLSSTPTILSSFISPPPLISSSHPSSLQPNTPSSINHQSYRLHPPRPGTANLTMTNKSQIPPFGVPKFQGFLNENERKIVRLNLEIGLLGESKSDDLDLELRLGCS